MNVRDFNKCIKEIGSFNMAFELRGMRKQLKEHVTEMFGAFELGETEYFSLKTAEVLYTMPYHIRLEKDFYDKMMESPNTLVSGDKFVYTKSFSRKIGTFKLTTAFSYSFPPSEEDYATLQMLGKIHYNPGYTSRGSSAIICKI